MVFSSRLCRSLLDGVAVGVDPVSRLSPFALARLALRASREQRTTVGLWKAIAARATSLAPQMQPTDMSTLLFSFAKLRYRDREMMARIAEATPPILGQFRAPDITFFLAAFARLDVQNKVVLNLFAREVARKIHDFEAAQLGELVYAYARLEIRHPLLLGILKKRIIEVVKALKPWHLAMVAGGFARLGVQDERFFAILASEVCRRISDFSGRPLALVANAYARIGMHNRFMLELIGDEAFRRRGEMEPQSVAMILNAHARLQVLNPVIFDYFAQDIPRRIRKYDLHSLCLVSSAIARSGRTQADFFHKVGEHLCNNAPKLYPRALACMIHAFAEVGQRHGTLFYNAPALVMDQVDAYSVDELAMIARAYGSFQMVHLPLFDAITATLPSRQLMHLDGHDPQAAADPFSDDMVGVDAPPASEPGRSATLPRASSLVWLLEAYARLTIFDANVLRLLGEAIARRRGELEPLYVVQALQAAAALSWADEGLIAMGADMLADGLGADLPVEELERLAQALRSLGAGSGATSDREPSPLLVERPPPPLLADGKS